MNKKTLLILVGIILLAGFLRMFQLTTTPPGLYPDEAMNGNNGLHAWRTGEFSWFYPENNGREALFINIQSAVVHYTGIHEAWVLRSVSTVFGTLTVLGIFFLIKELLGSSAGLTAAFLLATNVWHINFSRIGFRAITAPCFAIWGVYLLVKALKKESGLIVPSLLAGAVFAAGFHSYIAYRVMPVVGLVVVVLALWNQKKKGLVLGKTILAAIAGIIVIAPLAYYFIATPGSFFGRTSQVSVFSSTHPAHDLGVNILKTMGMFFVRGDENWRHNISGAPELFLPVAMLFAIGIILTIKDLWSMAKKIFHNFTKPNFTEKEEASAIAASWILTAGLPVVISNEGIPHALRAILMIPPVLLMATMGGLWAYKAANKHIHAIDLKRIVLALAIITAGNAYYQYFIRWAHNPEVQGAFTADFVQLGHTINTLPKETPKYIFVEAGGTLVNGIPMPTQTVMFITDTYDAQGQKEKNLRYILPGEHITVPEGAFTATIR